METFEIIFVFFFLFSIFLIFIFLFFIYKKFIYKQNNDKIEVNYLTKQIFEQILELQNKKNDQKSDLDNIKFGVNEQNNKIQKKANELTTLIVNSEYFKKGTDSIATKLEDINQIFSSTNKRGELGEIALEWILKECIGENDDIIKKQYTMKNKSRPDIFLKTNSGGIPIDSKFSFEQFNKVSKLSEKSLEYKKEIQNLVKSLKTWITDLSQKYISNIDDVYLVLLYLPYQSLFEFIHNKEEFSEIRKYAIKKNVIFTSSSNLPATLRLISIFERDKKQRENIQKIIDIFNDLSIETKRVNERWVKINQRINGLVEDKNKYNISINKLTNKISKTINADFSFDKNDQKKIK